MARARHDPVRTCVACRQEGLKADLVRLVRSGDGSVAVDRSGHAPGRGAYLHRNPACVEAARKRRQLERSLGGTVAAEVWESLSSPRSGEAGSGGSR
jgi:uncharacterized protein